MNSSEEEAYDSEYWNIWTGFWIEGVILPLIAALGIAGNVLCVFVFSTRNLDLKPAFSNLLKCLSVFDILFLMCIIWLYAVPTLIPQHVDYLEPLTTPYILPCTHIALTGSVYTVVAVALERFYNICRPFNRNLGSVWNGHGYIITIILFSVIYNIYKFFEFETVMIYQEDELSGEIIEMPSMNLTVLRNDPVYATSLLVINTTVVGVIPILVLTYLNFSIIRTMKKNTLVHNKICSEERRDQAMIALLSGIVVVLIVCHTPKTVINIYESYQMIVYGSLRYEPLWGKVLIKLSHLLLCLSSAVNIIIYSYKDFQFRSVLMKNCQHLSCTEYDVFRAKGRFSITGVENTRGTELDPCDVEVGELDDENEEHKPVSADQLLAVSSTTL